jgi:hypothetical protein
MEGSKGFSEIWQSAHRERSEYVWSIISRLMASPRRPAPPTVTEEVEYHPAAVPAVNR